VVISDTVPANTTFVSATAGGSLAAGIVTWSIGPLAAGASGSVQLVVLVASPLAKGTVITNSDYSIDSAETAPTVGASVTTRVSKKPIVTSAMELTSKSPYILTPGVQDILVTGTDFEQGAILSLGTGITSSPTVFIDTMHLQATLTIDPTVTLGPCDLTVTNPGPMSGSLPAALTVVHTMDISGDCSVDGLDLNTLARAWGTTSTDPAFSPEADFNADGIVDGDDLSLFAVYFGLRLPHCP